MLQPLIVPRRLANGKRSNQKMKEVMVQIFNKGDAAQAAVGGGKVSIRWIAMLMANADLNVQKVQNLPASQVPLRSNLVKRKVNWTSSSKRRRQHKRHLQTYGAVIFTVSQISQCCVGEILKMVNVI